MNSAVLHGWLLEGSGSNLWTRSVVRSLCRQGETVHLVCQENHPERYDFICAARKYNRDGSVTSLFERESAFSGKCILHQPALGEVLPVFVWDEYEQHKRVVPMIELGDDELESYIARNTAVVGRIVEEFGVAAIHANHAVLMPEVADRISRSHGIPFTIMPHGSDIEYAVKKDERFLRYASSAMSHAGSVFVIGEEMRRRVLTVFRDVPRLEEKLTELHLGVDTAQFEPVERRGRAERIEQLVRSLRDLPKGRKPEAVDEMHASLRGWSSGDDLSAILAKAAEYDAKKPDYDVEEKLNRIDWSAPTVLFVGRLIAAKGIQSVIAALPTVLQERPDLQLIVVGHGPLRELMEALIFALSNGRADLVSEIVNSGRRLEGAATGDAALSEVKAFFEHAPPADASTLSRAVTFTGYLTHHELKHLFACCDVGVFPSVVREAGPLVFLEAIASGCFPMGTYFGGMAASIDAVGGRLDPGAKQLMILDPVRTAEDIAAKLPFALDEAPKHRLALAEIARESYDWAAVSSKLRDVLTLLSGGLHQ